MCDEDVLACDCISVNERNESVRERVRSALLGCGLEKDMVRFLRVVVGSPVICCRG